MYYVNKWQLFQNGYGMIMKKYCAGRKLEEEMEYTWEEIRLQQMGKYEL